MRRKLEEEDPTFLMICPECKAFSKMQAINYSRMSFGQVMVKVQKGLKHLCLAYELALWQIKRGKYFACEHPLEAESWQEEEIQKLERMEGIHKAKCDMCRFGLSVSGDKLDKKPTGILTNSEEIFSQMSKRCTEDHVHESLEGGEKTRRAQIYIEEFCKQTMRGLSKQLHQDQKMRHHFPAEDGELTDEEEEEIEEPQEQAIEIAAEIQGTYTPTEAEKKAILKLHRGIGHPQLPDFIRFMKAAQIRGELIRWASKKFRCEAYDSAPSSKTVRPAAMPRTYHPNRSLALT